jgi:Protein of unknown function (DUF3667)
MNQTQIIGDALEAGLKARAVEPDASDAAGAADAGHTHECACLNCGTSLVGSHCHACGQAAHVHRTLGAFFHDLLHGVFHFEGKVFRTLPMLTLRPGKLTREYIDGRRASYVSPLALFLFSVFLLFAAIQSSAVEAKLAKEDQASHNDVASKGVAKARQELPALRQQRAELEAKGEETYDVDAEIASREQMAAMIDGVTTGEMAKSTGFTLLDSAIDKASANPSLAIYKMQSYAYKYSWALIPISVPFLWLLFPFSRRFHLYDHTVFITYSLSFMMLLIVAIVAADAVGASVLSALLVFAPPLHMYRQLRGAYGVSRAGALLRTAALGLFGFIALLIFTVGIAAQTGAG